MKKHAFAIAPRRLPLPVTLLAAALLGGCATGPNANPRDPMEPWNRGVYQFNDAVDRAVLKPVAMAYTTVTPEPVQTGVRNFFNNLGDAWSTVNSVLQARGQDAMNSFWRFTINSSFGLGGIFDVASEARIPQKKQDFGLTLARWGVGSGPYIVLPLLGPSTLRDTIALPVDMKGNPVGAIDDVSLRNNLAALGVVNQRAELMATTDLLDQAALDRYSFTRDAYLQHREARARGDSAPAASDQPSADDGYVPLLDDATPAAPVGMEGYVPPLPEDAASAPVATPPLVPASAPEHAGQTPYYAPAVPELLDKITPGWGGNLWRK